MQNAHPRPDHHLVFRGSFKKPYGTINSGVKSDTGDTIYPLQNASWGAWGYDLDAFEHKGKHGYAHEVGHLLGLGDDYIDHPATSQHARWTEPKPGRKNSLMADGGPVDKPLVDRLADLLRHVGKLPSCWQGKMHSESTKDYRNGPAFVICTEVWDLEVSLRAAPDGAVTGKATANFVAQDCKSYPGQVDFSHHALYGVFNAQGHFDQKQFELHFFETKDERAQADALRGFYGWNGLLNYTLFLGFHGGTQPTIIVPVVAPDRADGTTTIKRHLEDGTNATGVHEVHLTRESPVS
jgi:hypothetical protein